MADKKFPASSKFLSLVLRHKPELVGLRLDKNGWVQVEELLEKVLSYGKDLDLTTLKYIVASDEKKRYSFNENKTRIRANQGHSVKIDLNLEPIEPPEILYHGTTNRNVESILESGLQKKNRHHVHLSFDVPTALTVGKRRGKPVIYEVHSGAMFREGFQFFVSENGVWLTEKVPVNFLKVKGLK